MRLVLVILCACGGALEGAPIDNRGGDAECDVPARFDFDARRYPNIDNDQPDHGVWSPWRVGIQMRDRTHGTLAMVGDDLVWNFAVAGRVADCKLELRADTHEPITVTIDLRTLTGDIQSIDDRWELGNTAVSPSLGGP